ncbi:hypothetical protein D3C78_1414050 [compost metagenome]
MYCDCGCDTHMVMELTQKTIDLFKRMKAAEMSEGRVGMLSVFASSEQWRGVLSESGGVATKDNCLVAHYMIGDYLAWRDGKIGPDLDWIRDKDFSEEFATIAFEAEVDEEPESRPAPKPDDLLPAQASTHQDDFLSTLTKPRRKFALPI